MKKIVTILVTILGFLLDIKAQPIPVMRQEDKIRIKETITISNQFGDKIWKELNKTPFVIILVMDSVEFLINHPNPSTDFILSEEDSVLKTKILYRKRKYSKNFLATFPAVNGVNCIVVGTPENTGKSTTEWIITLLHEHFHQYQYTQKDHLAGIASLDLSGGDETGMWQLNYPLPYDSLPVSSQYSKYANALSKAVASIDNNSFKQALAQFVEERKKLTHLFKPADYRYFSFQLWQEGIARYTEYKFLQMLENYIPTAEVFELPDFVPFKKFKEEFLKTHLASVTALKFEKEKRICFYDIGLAEGILLDKLNKDWRSRYFTNRFYLENYATELQ